VHAYLRRRQAGYWVSFCIFLHVADMAIYHGVTDNGLTSGLSGEYGM
jgi:hypothetical protein